VELNFTFIETCCDDPIETSPSSTREEAAGGMHASGNYFVVLLSIVKKEVSYEHGV
jgi:hypothetical protein